MTQTRSRLAGALCATAVTFAFAYPAAAFTGEALAPQAKVGIAEARAIALKAQPGTIKDEELEHETGGSGLRYTFEVKSGAKVREIGVDAATGAVLENIEEGSSAD